MGACIVLLGAHYILHISRIRVNVVKLFLFGGPRGTCGKETTWKTKEKTEGK